MNRLRMCISCRELKPKKELIRIVKNDNGDLQIDTSYKLQTRGTYICKDKECILKLKKSSKLKRQFNLDVSLEFYNNLEKIVES